MSSTAGTGGPERLQVYQLAQNMALRSTPSFARACRTRRSLTSCAERSESGSARNAANMVCVMLTALIRSQESKRTR